MGKAKRKPDPEAWTEKHGCDGRPPIKVEGIADIKGRARVDRNTNHCTLCRLHHLGYLKDRVSDSSHDAKALSDMRHRAGEKLQDDHALAGQATIKGTLSSLEAGGGSACGPAEIAQMKIDADRRKARSLIAVGITGRFLLEKIALEDWTLEQAANIMRVNKKAVLPALRCALDALAAHYGMDVKGKAVIRAETIHPFHGSSEAADRA
jgi:hypothetical protein